MEIVAQSTQEMDKPGERVQFHRLAESFERSTFRAPAVMLRGLYEAAAIAYP
jgi:hypothetical protein